MVVIFVVVVGVAIEANATATAINVDDDNYGNDDALLLIEKGVNQVVTVFVAVLLSSSLVSI